MRPQSGSYCKIWSHTDLFVLITGPYSIGILLDHMRSHARP